LFLFWAKQKKKQYCRRPFEVSYVNINQNTMKFFFLFAIITLATIVARAQEVIVDPNAEARTLSGSFTAIKVSGGIDIYLSQSDNEAVAVSASEEKLSKDKDNCGGRCVENIIWKMRGSCILQQRTGN